MKKYECTVAMLARLGPIPCRFLHAPWLAMLLLMLVIAPRAAEAATIYVTTTQQKVTSSGGCSLQEAIYSANLQTNLAYQSGNGYISTQCIPGTGNDTLVLPTKAAFNMGNVLLDPTNYLGATATPLIFSNITIEANGSQLIGSGQFIPHRAFAVGGASVTLPGGATVSGVGSLTIRNAYMRSFAAKGGDGGCKGGGGMGAGGAIYLTAGQLTIESSTFERNGAIGGNGGTNLCASGLGGGGGLSGSGGDGAIGGGGGGGAVGFGGAGGTLIPGIPGGHGPQSLAASGGGGGGTFASGQPGSGDFRLDGLGGALCGGNASFTQNGSDATCAGGGGGGGGSANVGGNGGAGAYGGGGGGAGQGSSIGGSGGFGGGGGGDCAVGGFGGGGTPGCGGTPGGFFGGPGYAATGGGGGALGGAIFNEGGSVTVHNSTFTANFVTRGINIVGPQGNGADAGGAIFSLNGSLAVLNATISGNSGTGFGGGIEVFATSTASLNLYNTIIYNNGVNECFTDKTTSGAVVSAGFANLIGSSSNATCGVFVRSTADPQLGPLQNNQGPTPTMAIPTTSPAFNAAADLGTSLRKDQRGQTRPAMGGFDIGAFELCFTGLPILQMPCVISGGIEQAAQLTIQVSPAGGGTTTPSPGASNYALNSVVALTATPNTGFAFVNWTGAVADPNNPSTAIIMNNDQTVTANFAQVACVNNLSGRGTAGLFGRPERIDLTWIGFGNATSYNVLRGTSPGGENPVPIGTTATTAYTDTNGLVSGTTYYYVVQPVNGGVPACTSNETAVKAP